MTAKLSASHGILCSDCELSGVPEDMCHGSVIFANGQDVLEQPLDVRRSPTEGWRVYALNHGNGSLVGPFAQLQF